MHCAGPRTAACHCLPCSGVRLLPSAANLRSSASCLRTAAALVSAAAGVPSSWPLCASRKPDAASARKPASELTLHPAGPSPPSAKSCSFAGSGPLREGCRSASTSSLSVSASPASARSSASAAEERSTESPAMTRNKRRRRRRAGAPRRRDGRIPRCRSNARARNSRHRSSRGALDGACLRPLRSGGRVFAAAPARRPRSAAGVQPGWLCGRHLPAGRRRGAAGAGGARAARFPR